jgi:hypothetical protein
MSEPLDILMDNSIQIAWDYLKRAGEIDDAAMASRFLVIYIEGLIRRGERRRLLLSNKAATPTKVLNRSGRRLRVGGFGRLARGIPAVYRSRGRASTGVVSCVRKSVF